MIYRIIRPRFNKKRSVKFRRSTQHVLYKTVREEESVLVHPTICGMRETEKPVKTIYLKHSCRHVTVADC